VKIKIAKNGMVRFPNDLREEGYVGEVKVVVDAAAAVLEKPGATPNEIIKSLDILRKHYELLQEMEQNKEEQNG